MGLGPTVCWSSYRQLMLPLGGCSIPFTEQEVIARIYDGSLTAKFRVADIRVFLSLLNLGLLE